MAIQSVLQQTYRDIELVIVDDGSINSLECEILGFEDERVRFFRLKTNRGLHAARAFAVEQAAGEFVALLDDDDYWFPEKIEKQVTLMHANPQTFITCCGAIDIYPDGTKMTRLPPSKKITYRQELVYECTIASSVLFRRSAYEAVGGFDRQLYRCGDWDCWIRISKHYEIQAIMEPLVITRMRPNSLQRSYDVENFAKDRLRVLQKNVGVLKAEGLWNEALSWHYHSVGVRYFKMGQLDSARKWLLKAIQNKPRMVTLATFTLAWPLFNRFYNKLRWFGRSYKRIIRTASFR
jgi:glycosyltransferase involved in cell wall biosynthesis